MTKPLTPFAHGIADYATVATVAAAPRLMRLNKRASATCYTLAAGYATLSMMTDYPLSLRKAIPFKAHGVVEVAVGAMLPITPLALGFASDEVCVREIPRRSRSSCARCQ